MNRHGTSGFRCGAYALALACLVAFLPELAAAAQPVPWQMDFQPAATDNMAQVKSFNDFLLYIMAGIVMFVLLLMLYVMLRYNAKANPTPTQATHNTLLEVTWTVIPILILAVIAIPSFQLLYYQERIPPADFTVKAVGYQWYWGYEYPDHGDFAFDSLMLNDDERGDAPRLLATDTALVVPVDTTVRVLITAADVLHSWTVPAFGVKVDAVPGRINETWFRATRTGTFYGQCSELCGVRHSFMPIRVEVVSRAAFDAWVAEARREYAAAPTDEKLAHAAPVKKEL